MPYKNIVFVKLEKRLLNDPRWWTMTDHAQLFYVKMLMAAAELRNKIPTDPSVFRQLLRSELGIEQFNKCIKEVLENFPRIKIISINNKNFYYFSNFHEYTNYVQKKEIQRKSQGNPKDVLDKEKEEEGDKEKDKIKSKMGKQQQTDQEFIDSLKSNQAYKDIDVDMELAKMDAWLSTRSGKKKTRRWVVAWLNRIDRALPQGNGKYSQAQIKNALRVKELDEKMASK